MEEKYIDLLIKKCTELNTKKSLFINYAKETTPFIEKIIDKVKTMGIKDIYLDKYDPYTIHDFLKNSIKEEILTSPYFDNSIWDTYAKKDACFLIIETEYPHLMDDIDPYLLSLSSRIKRETKPIYQHMITNCQLSWTIAAYPSRAWAKELFKENNAYEKLKQTIFSICMLDEKDPITSWELFLDKQTKIITYLNNLKIEKLIYTNSLGTNLNLYLPKNYRFASAKDRNIIVNMPSYEIFTSPDYRKTEGIVYSAKSLNYNGGLIKDFWIRFSKGKVVDYDAKTGKNLLGEIIKDTPNSCYLGECALVEKTSPIAKTNMTFGTTLIDENASCHLALGAGFPECIENGLEMTTEELLAKGINDSKNHVDFMIGTNDIKITAITTKGTEIEIMNNGEYTKEILAHCTND